LVGGGAVDDGLGLGVGGFVVVDGLGCGLGVGEGVGDADGGNLISPLLGSPSFPPVPLVNFLGGSCMSLLAWFMKFSHI